MHRFVRRSKSYTTTQQRIRRQRSREYRREYNDYHHYHSYKWTGGKYRDMLLRTDGVCASFAIDVLKRMRDEGCPPEDAADAAIAFIDKMFTEIFGKIKEHAASLEESGSFTTVIP